MAWTGTDKQIAWAKALKAEAEPIITEWRFNQISRASRMQQRTSKFDRVRSEMLRKLNQSTYIMQEALKIEDARFWIDMPVEKEKGIKHKVLIDFYALRDANSGAYLGCMESTMDVEEIMQLTGEKRLIDSA